MIEKLEDYFYVTGDVDKIVIDGGVMPLRKDDDEIDKEKPLDAKRVLRGEDPAFLMESVAERQLALRGSYDPQVFDRRLFDQVKTANAFFIDRNSITTSRFGFVNPDLALQDQETCDTQTSPGVYQLAPYRDNYANLTDAQYFPAEPIPQGEFTKFLRSEVQGAFDNQRLLVKCFRPVTAGTQTGRGIWCQNNIHEFRNDEEISSRSDEFYNAVGEVGEIMMFWEANDKVSNNHIQGDVIFSSYNLTQYRSMDESLVAMVASGLPPGCMCTPVISWKVDQRWCDYPKYDNYLGYHTTRCGYIHGTPKVSGSSGVNSLQWTWRECNVQKVPVGMPGKVAYHVVPIFWEPVKESDFIRPDGTYANDFKQESRTTATAYPAGVIVELGDHTKWW